MRIIAGLYKGRNLLPPPGQSITRPITGSVKKSVFAMLGEDLSGQVVVDLFCGTGTLGIEAMSRGAVKCYFAEQDGAVVARLVRNLQDCRAEAQAVVWRGDVLRNLANWLNQVAEPVDVAFVDPPYAMARQWWPRDPEQELPTSAPLPDPLKDIFVPLTGKLADDGIVVVRTDTAANVPETLGPLATARVKKYGDMVVTFLKKATGSGQ